MIYATTVLVLISVCGSSALAIEDAKLTVVDGRYMRLETDLPASVNLQRYVDSFDQAVPLWVQYWNREAASVAGWRITAYLMSGKEAFERRGLIPESLPAFLHGYQSGDKIWVVNQASDFYTLHLLLHEGSHAIAHRFFGGAGPPWYMEGTAEYMATHEVNATGIRVGVIPSSREASPYWGRIGLIAARRGEGKIPSIETVMRYGDTAHRDVEPYAWSWAAAVLMEMYPEYRKVFRDAAQKGRDASPQFTRDFYQSLRTQWPVLSARWQLLCEDLDYGFDAESNRVTLSPLSNFGPGPQDMSVAADKGWQSAPAMIRSGQSIRVKSTGRFQLKEDPAWVSEADGVTITYERGRPLGQLLACIVPRVSPTTPSLPRLHVIAMGAENTVTASVDGWLLFKINENPRELADNRGTLELTLETINNRK